MWRCRNWKEENKIVFLENSKESTEKVLEMITEFIGVDSLKINMQKSIPFICENNKKLENILEEEMPSQ